ncbi:MAG: o-succinylbenzoate synthase [Gemmatimonadota bacterium]|nr:o-succinylbenzoate synthase [Gemmatimonadota bacterium]MDH3368641.1 o-succinylbenzoate synthase [Gemmatimonadota bacterium]MDH3477187.1 o-succinylbenzoate synthase [Gemmatimonadota bacterium]MDH3570614.1 o-succinylbenzoate synthase [Gemmatimonadota bacterium]MDH5551370.1 o-succinylbenzoate synthase [Gemmatimonadota bacterium]
MAHTFSSAMIEIAELSLREISLQLREPFHISSGSTDVRRVVLVRLEDRDGVEGWGECVAGETPHYSSETVDTAWLAIRDWVAPRVVGIPLSRPEECHERLDAAIRGHRMARAAAEMAVWDLAARRESVALSVLLGGVRDRVATGISLGLQPDPATLVRKAILARDAGYRRIKLKIAPDRDISFVSAVREALGESVPLSVDANAAYSLADIDRLKALDGLDLTMLEQPFDGDDLVRHAALQRVLRTPICLDESITSTARLEDMVTLDAGRIVNLKPGRVGGLTEARTIHDHAGRHRIPVWCGGMLETGVGRAHNVALASLPQFELPGDLSPSARYWVRDIVTPPWTMEDGTLRVPREHSGIGVDIDHDYVDDLTTRAETIGG